MIFSPEMAMQQQIIHQISTDQIDGRAQVRKKFDSNQLDELAASIREVGIQQPVQVCNEGGRYTILIGERRWRAAQLAGLATVPAIIADQSMTEADIIRAQLIENVHREDLSFIEQARAIAELMKFKNIMAAEAAKQIGKSPATVSKLLSLLTLPDDTQAKVAAGEIGLRVGHAMARDAKTPEPSMSRPPRKQKLTAVLDRNRSVCINGVDSTMEAFFEAIETLLVRLKSARKQGLELPTTLAMFRDQAGI